MDEHAESILGFGVTNCDLGGCVEMIGRWIEGQERGRYLACVNPHSMEVARKDGGFERALKSADVLIPDGIGIVIASKMLRGSLSGRVTGSDIFAGVNRACDRRGGVRYFFLGSTDETLGKIRTRMAHDFPRITVAGTYAPPFRNDFSESDTAEMVRRVNESSPHVLWVGMTAPKQEKWISEHRNRMNVSFIGAIGAVFDFYAGNIRRSHPAFQGMGLEWLPRLFQEPRRLWRRTIVSAPGFMVRVLQERWRKREKR